MKNAYAVILAGGKGERFWPLSTTKTPKQFLSLISERSMLGMAVDRLEGLIPPERVLVLTNGDLADAARAAAPELPPENVIGEPMGRDTAAAAALGCAAVLARDPEGVFCVLTADHVMGDLDVFRQTLAESMAFASDNDVLMTIGITPDFPSTGYGYIEAGDSTDHAGDIPFRKAERFVEKPDRDTAQSYLDTGRFFWNSGMFIWSAAHLQAAFNRHRPQLSEMIDALIPAFGQPDFAEQLLAQFEPLEKISIDYALMEKADNIMMAEGRFAWDDVGSWPAVAKYFDEDEAENATSGQCATVDSNGNIIFSRDRVTAVIGVSDLIVVQADGVTLVCPKDRAQDIKQLVAEVKANPDYTHLI